MNELAQYFQFLPVIFSTPGSRLVGPALNLALSVDVIGMQHINLIMQ
jgi:hypothetical protein